ncbi:hypothetical protein CMI37_32915 [Candidatus Pacearchaeota archaeon]|nr:hypothetical protein [Candidatus Pacearchaeota archaeon]|tara:strand:- start:605 stop:1309 length:705 start_codon:yes stop_codon:yes gene_type:complete
MEEKPNYYAVLPAKVRYDKSISHFSKLLFAEVVALSNKEGHCWATNSYFAKCYDITKETVSRAVSALQEAGYITVNFEYEGKEIKKRIININPIDKKVIRGIDENINRGIDEKGKDNTINNNTINNNNTRVKEQFEIFWKNIKGRKINKKRAWNYYCKIETNLDDLQLAQKYNALIDNTKDLKFVPHPERWLRDERWNDEEHTHSNHFGTQPVFRDNEGYIISKEEFEKAQELR